MVKLNKKLVKKLLRSILLGVLIGLILCLPGVVTYACIQPQSPNVVVTIDKNGKISYTGNMFDNSLWYPGKQADGTIRITNQYKRIKVTDLAVEMKLLKWKPEYNRDFVEDSFLRNMKLSLQKKNSLFQNQDIIKNQCLYIMLNRVGDRRYQGYHLDNASQFYLDKGDFLDLNYTLVMDRESGNELQDLTANVGVMITVAER
jgi:hypothetical protein